MLEITLISVIFLLTIGLIVLRFTTVLRHILDTSLQDRANRASELDHAHEQAFNSAMTALESINQRVVEAHTDMLRKTMDTIAGPQERRTDDRRMATDNPSLDNRPPWAPDDDWDYSHLGIDPTDETLPMPPLEPDDNQHRAVMLPPGQGLLPKQD